MFIAHPTVQQPLHRTLVRRETRRRLVRVAAVEQITPKMRRIHFASLDLHDFESLAPDDHVKLFVPNPVTAGGNGNPCMRDYTPRAFDPMQGTLTIDFALHEAGPATAWALAAQPGDAVEIGGPRGSVIVADDFDWYLLIGDETALPAIGRQVESLRAGVPVKTITVISDDAERLAFTTRAAWQAVWVCRDGKPMTADCCTMPSRLLAPCPMAMDMYGSRQKPRWRAPFVPTSLRRLATRRPG